MKNGLDEQYIDLLKDILENGVEKNTRNGKVLSVFGRSIRYKFKDGKFPLLTTKKMYFKGIVTELLWFLRGDTNIKYLVDNDCHIWDGDAYKNYCNNINLPLTKTLPLGTKVVPTLYTQEEFINKIKTDDEFAKTWGDLGPIYGKQWRNWKFTDKFTNGEQVAYVNGKIDQIANLINDLKTNPDSRRLMVKAWNVGELDSMTLPPCHYGFQVYTRELSFEERYKIYDEGGKIDGISSFLKEQLASRLDLENIPTRAISLMWNQRSVDTFLGLPFNIASYGLLLEIIAKEVNMVPDELIGNLGDTHLYLNHIEQAKEQIGRELDFEERSNIYKDKYNIPREIALPFVRRGGHNLDEIPKRTREPYPLPKLFFKYEKETYIDNYELDGFFLKDYQSHPTIKAPLSN